MFGMQANGGFGVQPVTQADSGLGRLTSHLTRKVLRLRVFDEVYEEQLLAVKAATCNNQYWLLLCKQGKASSRHAYRP